MRFLLSDEQAALAEAIDDIVLDAGGADVARSWGAGDTSAGSALWAQLAELGLFGLRVSEDHGGLGASLTDLTVVFERLGYHAVPGPYIETIALLPALVDTDVRADILAGAPATAAVAGVIPAALDAAVATHRFVVTDVGIATASIDRDVDSLAATRRLALLSPNAEIRPVARAVLSGALDESALAASAYLIGAGERLLAEAIAYAGVREQFGRRIGEFQALKHQLADVRIALSFAKPLVWSAALDDAAPTRARDVSAAKVAAADAATFAARVSLQVHGAIGYTAEHPLHLWLGLVPALVGVWGTSRFHRSRVARALKAA